LRRFERDAQNAPDGFVQHGFVQRSVTHRFDDGLTRVGLGAGHFQVQPAFKGGYPVVDRAPVGDDEAFKAPFFFSGCR
jgi:hypothetical protein